MKLSEIYNREIVVNVPICNKVCKTGAIFSDPIKSADFVKVTGDNYYRFRRLPFLDKIKTKYAERRPVVLPAWWDELKQQLSETYKFAFIKTINLTGSAIHESPTKDLDLIIHISNWGELKNNWEALHATLPKTFHELPFDVFFHKDWYGMFVQLDCENRILHCPSSFPTDGREIDPLLKVVSHDDKNEMDKAIGIAKEWERAAISVGLIKPTPSKMAMINK